MSQQNTTPVVAELDEAAFDALTADVAVPIEQSRVWEAFDAATPGRRPWGVYAIRSGEQTWCVIRLSAYQGRGFSYLWAKHGPVWLVEVTRERESQVRRLLVEHIRSLRPRTAFLRLHGRYRAEDTHELLQTVTYDRTVIVDLTAGEEEVFAKMRQRGRRTIRKGLKDDSLTVVEETGLDRPAFDDLYDVLVETGQRDGFGISDSEMYWTMLQTLGTEHGRIFVTRREGRPLAWAIVTVHDGQAVYYYGASSAEGRKAWAADLLHWRIMQTLMAEGVASYDFMGTASDRAPGLGGVTEFKRKFAPEVDTDGAWDVPVRPRLYRVLVAALAAKRRAQTAGADLRVRLRGGSTRRGEDGDG